MKKYQVVLQLPELFFASFDEIVDFEEQLIDSLPRTHNVDGHDIGSGTVNFFVYTDSPRAMFQNFRKYMGRNRVVKNLRAAFRPVDVEDYRIIWPASDERDFKVS